MNRILYLSIAKENSITEARWEELTIYGIRLRKQEMPVNLVDRIRQIRQRKKFLREVRGLMADGPSAAVYIRPEHRLAVEQFLGDESAEYLNSYEQLELLMAYVKMQKNLKNLEEMILDVGRQEWEVGRQEWFAGLWNHLNYFTVITDHQEEYDGIGQDIYEETGLMLQFAENTRQLESQMANRRYLKKGKSLWLDLSGGSIASYRCIPQNCIYIDAESSHEKERNLSVKRPDTSYFSLVKFLDTILSSTV